MFCPSCKHENRADRKFCVHCGAGLELTCRSCGASAQPGERFCGECGTARRDREGSDPARPSLLHPQAPRREDPALAQSALEGERKQVTVLFADVKGSMELAEQLDPEEWHQILDRFFAILTDGVHRFEGTVNQYTGDGIMALFGAPIAHEDHAQRACYAALHLRDELRALRRRGAASARRSSFSVRMGINSGEVVVGRIGDDLRMDYTAQGHTVGLAQRMEQLAAPGRVYLTAHTARLVAGYFALAISGEFESRACSEPRARLRARGARRGAHALRRLARPRPLAVRRARRRDGDAGGRARARRRGQRAGGRRRGRGGHRQEPAVLRVRRALPRARHARLRGDAASRTAGTFRSCRSSDVPRLLRHHRARRRSARAREDRRAPAAARRGLPRGAAGALRLLRRARPASGRCRASTRRRASASSSPCCASWCVPTAQRAGAGGPADRGPALDRRRQRGVPRADGSTRSPARAAC